MNQKRLTLAWCAPLFLLPLVAQAQEAQQIFTGMWGDPPLTLEDQLCRGYCVQPALDHLNALLDDPANDERAYTSLRGEAVDFGLREYIEPLLSAAARETYPLDQLKDDPGYTICEPWGLARQIFAPHQMELHQDGAILDMHYGEWDAHRTVYMDGRSAPPGTTPSLLGYSVGHYEGDTLVIESSHISANITRWWSRHSDQLKVTERYVRDGARMVMTATLEDPWGLNAPFVGMRVWNWAPGMEIYPYDQCVPGAGSVAAKGE